MNENVTVCITPKGDKPILHFSQFDNERVFTVTVLADDGESAAVLTGLDIEFRLRKTDSHVVTIAPESVADNMITFKTTEQLCACCGQNIASVVLMKDDMIISTLDILVDIQRDILSGGLTSESDIRNLTTQIEQIVPEVVGDDYYNKQEVDDLLAEHTFDPTKYYDKQEVDELIAEHTFDPTNYYDKSDVDSLLSDKADSADVYTKTETDNLLAEKADKSSIASLIVQKDVAKAPIASFNTDLNDNLTKCIVDINPVQDLHGYTKPWSGGGGKNKANKANDLPSGSGITVTVANDGTLTINGTSTEVCYIRGYFNCPDSTATYTWALFNNKAFESGVEFSVRTSDNSSAGGWAKVNATNKTFSFTPSATPTKWQFQISSGITFNNAVFKPMIVSGNTAPTDYEPYSNICPISGFSALNVTLADGDMQTVDTATVNFGQTVYGGEVDLTNGKVTLTHGFVDLGDVDWVATGDGRFKATISDIKIAPIRTLELLCSVYQTNLSGNAFLDNSIYNGSNEASVIVYDSAYASSTASAFKTAMSGVQLVYELATPIEITTSPENLTALSGQNNVYSDTNGDTAVRFTETIGNELGV